jgi:hypothetical protein
MNGKGWPIFFILVASALILSDNIVAMVNTFNHCLSSSTQRIDYVSTFKNNMSTLICGAILMITVTWAVYDYRDWVDYGQKGLNKCLPRTNIDSRDRWNTTHYQRLAKNE